MPGGTILSILSESGVNPNFLIRTKIFFRVVLRITFHSPERITFRGVVSLFISQEYIASFAIKGD